MLLEITGELLHLSVPQGQFLSLSQFNPCLFPKSWQFETKHKKDFVFFNLTVEYTFPAPSNLKTRSSNQPKPDRQLALLADILN